MRIGLAAPAKLSQPVSTARVRSTICTLERAMDLSLPRPPIAARRDLDERHDAKVRRIARELARHDGRKPVSLKKKAVAHQVPKRGDKRRHDFKIDISELDEILDIDPVARTCTAEPGVTFVDLVEAT